ncbi:MAG: hypothetical protein ACJ8F7_09860 [Gemmataceae bacterium]
MDNPLPYIIGGVVALVAVILILSWYMEKKRTEAFAKLAESLNFEFQPLGSAELMRELASFHLFSLGHSKKIKNLLRGEANGLEVCIFDYRYVVGHGKHQQTHQQSVFLGRADDMDLPRFSMRPESIWHKIGGLLGYKDIEIDTHPKFSKMYLLKGPDADEIREAFGPEVLEYFEDRPKLNVEGDGGLLLFYRYTRLKPEQIRDFLAEGFEVLSLFRAPKEE